VSRHPIFEIVVDCADPQALAEFYSALTDTPIRSSHEGWASLEPNPTILAFQQVPERKRVKNRVHVDFDTDDLIASAALAVALGGRQVSDVINEGGGAFIVLADPEDNEFCFVSGYPIETGPPSPFAA
jgi:hypothetical protein